MLVRCFPYESVNTKDMINVQKFQSVSAIHPDFRLFEYPLDTSAMVNLILGPSKYDVKGTATQLAVAINDIQRTNEHKYSLLHRALTALVTGMFLTAVREDSCFCSF